MQERTLRQFWMWILFFLNFNTIFANTVSSKTLMRSTEIVTFFNTPRGSLVHLKNGQLVVMDLIKKKSFTLPQVKLNKDAAILGLFFPDDAEAKRIGLTTDEWHLIARDAAGYQYVVFNGLNGAIIKNRISSQKFNIEHRDEDNILYNVKSSLVNFDFKLHVATSDERNNESMILLLYNLHSELYTLTQFFNDESALFQSWFTDFYFGDRGVSIFLKDYYNAEVGIIRYFDFSSYVISKDLSIPSHYYRYWNDDRNASFQLHQANPYDLNAMTNMSLSIENDGICFYYLFKPCLIKQRDSNTPWSFSLAKTETNYGYDILLLSEGARIMLLRTSPYTAIDKDSFMNKSWPKSQFRSSNVLKLAILPMILQKENEFPRVLNFLELLSDGSLNLVTVNWWGI